MPFHQEAYEQLTQHLENPTFQAETPEGLDLRKASLMLMHILCESVMASHPRHTYFHKLARSIRNKIIHNKKIQVTEPQESANLLAQLHMQCGQLKACTEGAPAEIQAFPTFTPDALTFRQRWDTMRACIAHINQKNKAPALTLTEQFALGYDVTLFCESAYEDTTHGSTRIKTNVFLELTKSHPDLAGIFSIFHFLRHQVSHPENIAAPVATIIGSVCGEIPDESSLKTFAVTMEDILEDQLKSAELKRNRFDYLVTEHRDSHTLQGKRDDQLEEFEFLQIRLKEVLKQLHLSGMFVVSMKTIFDLENETHTKAFPEEVDALRQLAYEKKEDSLLTAALQKTTHKKKEDSLSTAAQQDDHRGPVSVEAILSSREDRLESLRAQCIASEARLKTIFGNNLLVVLTDLIAAQKTEGALWVLSAFASKIKKYYIASEMHAQKIESDLVCQVLEYNSDPRILIQLLQLGHPLHMRHNHSILFAYTYAFQKIPNEIAKFSSSQNYIVLLKILIQHTPKNQLTCGLLNIVLILLKTNNTPKLMLCLLDFHPWVGNVLIERTDQVITQHDPLWKLVLENSSSSSQEQALLAHPAMNLHLMNQPQQLSVLHVASFFPRVPMTTFRALLSDQTLDLNVESEQRLTPLFRAVAQYESIAEPDKEKQLLKIQCLAEDPGVDLTVSTQPRIINVGSLAYTLFSYACMNGLTDSQIILINAAKHRGAEYFSALMNETTEQHDDAVCALAYKKIYDATVKGSNGNKISSIPTPDKTTNRRKVLEAFQTFKQVHGWRRMSEIDDTGEVETSLSNSIDAEIAESISISPKHYHLFVGSKLKEGANKVFQINQRAYRAFKDMETERKTLRDNISKCGKFLKAQNTKEEMKPRFQAKLELLKKELTELDQRWIEEPIDFSDITHPDKASFAGHGFLGGSAGAGGGRLHSPKHSP
jgi:hypothetical protein